MVTVSTPRGTVLVAPRRPSKRSVYDSVVANAVQVGKHVYDNRKVYGKLAQKYEEWRPKNPPMKRRRLNPTHSRSLGFRMRVRKSKRKTYKKRTQTVANFGKGLAIAREEYGTVGDADCIYLMHSAIDSDTLILQTLHVFIKKLLKMGIRWDCPSVDEEINSGYTGTVYNPDDGLVIALLGGNVATTDLNTTALATFTVADGATVASMAQNFLSFFRTYSSGSGFASDTNTVEPRQFILYYNSTKYPTLATIELANEVVHFKGSSFLKMQNRSVAASSTAEDQIESTDVVDSKPLTGYKYVFDGFPRTRVQSTGKFKNIGVNAQTKIFGATNLGSFFKEPPKPALFANIKSSKRIDVNPGECVTSYVSAKGHMLFLKLMKKLRDQISATGSINIYSPFVTGLVALEEYINTGDTNLNTAGFENQIKLSVSCVTQKKMLISQTAFSQAKIDQTTTGP